MGEYLSKHDSLALEDVFFEIPSRREFIARSIGKGKRVLDVGCLGGRLSAWISERYNDVWGLEVNPRAAEVARSRGVQVTIADAEDGLPFESGRFDFVIVGELLEHLYDTQAFFEECARVLKKDGQLLLTVSNLNSLSNRLRVLRGDFLERSGSFPEDHYGGHIRQFNEAKLRELCRRTGFRIEEIRGVPALESKGPWIDRGLALAGRLVPSAGKLLLMRAAKISN